MRLLTGPHGSGKTELILQEFREAAEMGRTDLRLLVPTATLAEHYRHKMARSGVVLRPELIQTFARFTGTFADHWQLASKPMLYLLVEEALLRIAPREFEGVRDAPGFPAALAQSIEMLDSAGYRPLMVPQWRKEAPLLPPLAMVWQSVEEELAKRGMLTRAGLLRYAAEQVQAQRRVPFRHLYFDGFSAFSDPELRMVHALGQAVNVVVALPTNAAAAATRARFKELRWKEQVLSGTAASPARICRFAARTLERETEEVARRILQHVQQGKSFGEIGIAFRNTDRYMPVLESTLERFGIPARFYFGTPLLQNPAIRFLAAIVNAIQNGWDHKLCLAALRLLPQVGASHAMDQFDFRVREQLPNRGLEPLEKLAGNTPIQKILSEWRKLEPWRNRRATPGSWAERLTKLRVLFQAGLMTPGESWDRINMHRKEATALTLWEAAMREAAVWWSGRQGEVKLSEFWHVAWATIRLTPLRIGDQRRNVVHVMSVHEARQWRLPVLFLCGMAEGEFPCRHAQNPFLPDAAIRRIQRFSMRFPTSAERDAEEEPLFLAVRSRAQQELVLSYTTEGDKLPSPFYVAEAAASEEGCLPVTPAPWETPSRWKPPAAIVSKDLLTILHSRTRQVSVTGLESYLQCPFQFFAEKILQLREAPCRPEDRLNRLEEGSIVHEVLAKWFDERPAVEPLFEQIFEEHRKKLRIPPSYKTEMLRQAMRNELKRFVENDSWPRGNVVEVEKELTFEIGEGIVVNARIDRMETLEDGSAVIVDYKYSTAASTKSKVDDPTRLQGPLYVFAIRKQQEVAAMVYRSLRRASPKGKTEVFGWGSVPGLEVELNGLEHDWVMQGVAEALRAVAECRTGRMHPRPQEEQGCLICRFQEACRQEEETETAITAGV